MSRIKSNTYDGYFFFGKLIRTHGYKGGLKALLDVDQPQEYRELEMVFVEIRDKLIPWVIESIHLEGQKANIKLQDVGTMEAAERLVGSILFLPLELLPKLRGNKFYYHEVTGFKVNDARQGYIGQIERVLDLPGNPLLVVQFDQKEILLPITDAIIKKVDRKKKQIDIEAPEGLLDIYL
jgi:16S rRNA processing protein RimM